MAVDYPSYQGKPFQVISNSNIRYTGIFDSIDQVAQTVCLREVWCWGSEDRPVARPTPPKSENLGWVLFKTNAISSLAVINNYVEPGHAAEAFGDDSLVSVSQDRPDGPSSYPSGPPTTQQPPQQGPPGLSSQFSPPSNNIPLSDRPSQPPRKSSAATAMDRVQQSLSNLSVQRGPEPVPDTEFDFSQTRQFEQQREDHRRPSDRRDSGASDEDQAPGPAPAPEKKPTAYKKSDDFFDGLTDHSTRVARFQEVTRNLDTFGEEGGQVTDGHIPGYNARGRGRGRGGFGQGGRGGYGGERGGRGGYGGRGGHNGGEGRGGYNRSGGYDNDRGEFNDQRRGGFGNGGGYNTGGESGRGRGRARNDNAWRGGRGEQGLAPTHAAFD